MKRPDTGAGIETRWRAGLAVLTRATTPPPRFSRWAWTADAILAFLLTVAVLNTLGEGIDRPVVVPPIPAPAVPDGLVILPGPVPQVSWWMPPLAVLTTLPLAVRRRYPLAAFWAVTCSTLLLHHAAGPDESIQYTFVACLVVAYSAAMYSPYRVSAVALSLVAGAALIAQARDSTAPDVKAGYVPFFLLLAIGFAANTIHTWKQRVADLEAEQEASTRLAVERERSRIARELHDVVTHNVSVMVIQAGAARKVMDAAPDQARDALLAVESGGRAAMAELRHVMGLLTMDSDGPDPAATADLAPQPGLGQVAALADRIRETGVPVELSVTGAPVPLSAGADLAAYRVVQEGLTNTVRHAAGAGVRISVHYAPGEVRVDVADTGGRATSSAASGNGRGLTGLRERLAVYGGTLQAGPRPTGGYRLRAVIPVEEP